ncbi:MAG: V-type ATP synthase subunit K [Bacteroidales bacterium]|jgi:V/A-type H+-transporting ATPase subunit K
MEQALLPLLFAYVGMAIMLAMGCCGSAAGVTIVGNTTLGALRKNPDMYGQGLILSAIPATQGLYSFAGFFLMLNAIKGLTSPLTQSQGLAMFAASISLGFAAFFSARRQASICANGVTEIGNGRDVFGKTLILAVFPELYAILAFAATFLALP